MKTLYRYLHYILIGTGVCLLLLHFFLHLTANCPMVVALVLELAGIALYVHNCRKC